MKLKITLIVIAAISMFTSQETFAKGSMKSQNQSLKEQLDMIEADLARQSALKSGENYMESLYKSLDSKYYIEVGNGIGRSLDEAKAAAVANAKAQLTLQIMGAIGVGSTSSKGGSKDVIEYIQIDYIQQLLNSVKVKETKYTNLSNGSVQVFAGVELSMTASEISAGMKSKIDTTLSSLMSGKPTAGLLATRSYGARGMWRSMIVPGWGQFYKKSPLKGSLILAGVASTVVAATYANGQANEYRDMISKTYDVDLMRTYANKSNNYGSIRNICIGAAAAIYVYNIIDAIAAPGAKRIIVKKGASTTLSYGIAPTIMNDGSVGISGGLRF